MSEFEPIPPVEQPFQFSTRLLFTYVAAAITYVATGDSLWITLVAFAAWAVMTARLFWRFRVKALWSLIGAPGALYWAWLELQPPLVPGMQVI